MSEHTRIIGKCQYDHMPYRETGFTYCRHCKDFTDKAEVCFNEGWFTDWMQVNCGKCGKVMWVCAFKTKDYKFKPKGFSEYMIYLFNRVRYFEYRKFFKELYNRPKEEEDLDGFRIFPKDDQRCAICKKKTNQYDAVAYGGKLGSDKTNYWCSRKCYNEANKREDKQRKKNL